jgi:putative membrane protein
MSDPGVSHQRLAQRSIGYRSLEMAARLGWILLFVTFGSSQLLAAWQTGLLIAGGLLAAGGYQFVFWRRFEYELTEDTFDIRSGVFSRRTREIPLDRVQNVDLQRNVFQQAVGLTEVRLETAGGSTTEATLRFVTEAEAARLREAISLQKRAAGSESTAEAESVAGEQPPAEERHETLFEISPRELGLLGLISVDLRLLSILTVLLPLVLPSVGRRVGGEGPLMSAPLVSFALGAPIAAFFIVFVTAIVSGVFTLTNYWGFQLRRGAEELLYDRGLLQRFSGTIPLEKVQAFAISENVLARRLGYALLSVETAGQHQPVDIDLSGGRRVVENLRVDPHVTERAVFEMRELAVVVDHGNVGHYRRVRAVGYKLLAIRRRCRRTVGYRGGGVEGLLPGPGKSGTRWNGRRNWRSPSASSASARSFSRSF